MVQVRFVTGKFSDFEMQYDTEWPTVPRVGEKLSIRIDDDEVADWVVKDVCYIADADETLVGAMVLIKSDKIKVMGR